MQQDIFKYISENYVDILIQGRDHILISLLAVAIAGFIGIFSGYFASKSEKVEAALSGPFQVLRVIPSLAIIILLIPFIGTGVVPALIALTILAIPPILFNTIVGFKEVPYFMIETAEAMGMTNRQIFWKVRGPLAIPMIFSGIRIALVEVIASATLAAKIGAGGLGEIVFTGLGLNRPDLLIVGGVSIGILSLGSGMVFDMISKKVIKYRYV